MALYFVDYDLRKQRDYQKLYDALSAFNAVRVLKSLWCFKRDNTTCSQLRDHLKQHVDKDDALMVSSVTDWASLNTLSSPNKLS